MLRVDYSFQRSFCTTSLSYLSLFRKQRGSYTLLAAVEAAGQPMYDIVMELAVVNT